MFYSHWVLHARIFTCGWIHTSSTYKNLLLNDANGWSALHDSANVQFVETVIVKKDMEPQYYKTEENGTKMRLKWFGNGNWQNLKRIEMSLTLQFSKQTHLEEKWETVIGKHLIVDLGKLILPKLRVLCLNLKIKLYVQTDSWLKLDDTISDDTATSILNTIFKEMVSPVVLLQILVKVASFKDCKKSAAPEWDWSEFLAELELNLSDDSNDEDYF